MPGLVRYTDVLPLRELAPELLDLLQEVGEPGCRLEQVLDARPRPDALVLIALDAAGAKGACLATFDGELLIVVEIDQHTALHTQEMRAQVVAAARKRWAGWEPRSLEAKHAA